MNIGFVCLLECVTNMIVSFIYVITAPWKFGYILCRLSSFLMELVPVVYTMLLLSLLVDRVSNTSITHKSLNMNFKETIPIHLGVS